MIKYKKYQLLAESTNVKLSKDINELLKKGWLLYGETFMQDGIFFQAMVSPVASTAKQDEHEKE
jgi:hypothetical protein